MRSSWHSAGTWMPAPLSACNTEPPSGSSNRIPLMFRRNTLRYTPTMQSARQPLGSTAGSAWQSGCFGAKREQIVL